MSEVEINRRVAEMMGWVRFKFYTRPNHGCSDCSDDDKAEHDIIQHPDYPDGPRIYLCCDGYGDTSVYDLPDPVNDPEALEALKRWLEAKGVTYSTGWEGPAVGHYATVRPEAPEYPGLLPKTCVDQPTEGQALALAALAAFGTDIDAELGEGRGTPPAEIDRASRQVLAGLTPEDFKRMEAYGRTLPPLRDAELGESREEER